MQVLRTGKNGDFKITPLIIESKLNFKKQNLSDEENSPTDSPCYKKQYSIASTIASPLSTSSMKGSMQIKEIPELHLDDLCHSYHQNGYCMHGTECTLLHCTENNEKQENQRQGKRKSIILQNFPELLVISPLRKNKSFFY